MSVELEEKFDRFRRKGAAIAGVVLSLTVLSGCCNNDVSRHPDSDARELVEVCDDRDGSVVAVPDSDKHKRPYLPVNACVVVWVDEEKEAWWRAEAWRQGYL